MSRRPVFYINEPLEKWLAVHRDASHRSINDGTEGRAVRVREAYSAPSQDSVGHLNYAIPSRSLDEILVHSLPNQREE